MPPILELFRAGALRALGAEDGHMPRCSDIHSIRNAGRLTANSIHVHGGDSKRMGANLERIYKLRESG